MAITKKRAQMLRRKFSYVPKGVEVSAQRVSDVKRELEAVYEGRVTNAFAFRIAVLDQVYPAAPAAGK